MKETAPIIREELRTLMRCIEQRRKEFPSHSGWWSSYVEDPNENLPILLEALQKTTSRITADPKIFLDCGSGDGVVGHLAAMAGFTTVYGIECNPFFSQLSEQLLQELKKEGVSSAQKVNFCAGSYYLPEYVPTLIPACKQQLRQDYEKEALIGGTFTEYLTTVLNQENRQGESLDSILTAYFSPPTMDNPYQTLDLLNKNNQLIADMVYIFPSDIFFEHGFIPQMARLMKNHALLSVLSPADDEELLLPHPFYQQERIFIPFPQSTAMQLCLYEKKD